MKSSNLNKNAIYSTIKSIAAIVFPLITFPYISRVLQAENVGKVNFGSSIVSYFSLIATLGVNTYAIRECSKLRNNSVEMEKTASQIFSLNIITTVVSYIALIITLLFAKPLEDYRVLICIQSVSIMFTTLGADWINSVFEDFRYITMRTVFMQVLSVVLMFLLVGEPQDYLKYALIGVLASSGGNIVNVFYRRKFCRIRFTFSMDIKKHLPPIILLFSMIVAQTVYCNSDMTILGLIRGDVEVGLYSTAVKIYNIVNTLVASVMVVVMPKLSQAYAVKDYKSINENLKYALGFIVTLGIPCIVGLNVITPQLIECIAGKEYLGATWSLRILTIALAGSFTGGFISNLIMLPSGREKVSLKASVTSMLLNVILNIFLIPVWGLNAAALTTALAEIVGIFIVAPHIEKEIQIQNVLSVFKAPLIGGIGIIIIAFVFRTVSSNVWMICGGTILCSVVWYGIILFILKNDFFMGLVGNRFKR